MAEFELKALITGVDRLSPALSKMQKKIRGFKRQAEEASQGGLALGGGLAAGLTLSLKSYADQENAATGLKVAMMDANGEVGKRFQDINKLAIGLGNQLPGTTADFQNMMQMLVRQGIPAENILGGVGKATAYLAVQLKNTGSGCRVCRKDAGCYRNGVRRHDGAVRHYPEGVLSGR